MLWCHHQTLEPIFLMTAQQNYTKQCVLDAQAEKHKDKRVLGSAEMGKHSAGMHHPTAQTLFRGATICSM